jgi:hypothetical protein
VRQQALLAVGIDDAAGERNAGVEVANIAARIGVSRVKLIADTVAEGEARSGLPLVLRKEVIVDGLAVVVLPTGARPPSPPVG